MIDNSRSSWNRHTEGLWTVKRIVVRPMPEEGNQLVIYIEMPVGRCLAGKTELDAFSDLLILFFFSLFLFLHPTHSSSSSSTTSQVYILVEQKKKKRNTSFIKILLFIHYICIYKNKQPMRNVSHRILFYKGQSDGRSAPDSRFHFPFDRNLLYQSNQTACVGRSILTSTLIAAHENDGPVERLTFVSSWE